MTRTEAKLFAAVRAVTDSLNTEDALTILIACVMHRCMKDGHTRQQRASLFEAADTALLAGGYEALKGMT